MFVGRTSDSDIRKMQIYADNCHGNSKQTISNTSLFYFISTKMPGDRIHVHQIHVQIIQIVLKILVGKAYEIYWNMIIKKNWLKIIKNFLMNSFQSRNNTSFSYATITILMYPKISEQNLSCTCTW